MANRNFANKGNMYMMEVKPVMVSCNFIVDSTNGNGLGIRSLKGPLVSNVYMTTSATKAVGSPGGTTGPAAGTIVVQLQDNYSQLLGGSYSLVSPASGSNLLVASAGLTAGVAYIITVLGTTTTAAWHTLGVPVGLTPSVGMSFIASATSAVGTGAVQVTATTGTKIFQIETVGDSNQSIAPSPIAGQGYGAQLIFQCRDSNTNASEIVTPANGSVIQLTMMLSDSSVTVQGE